MPEGVRLFLTSRKDAQVENEFPGAEGLYLSAPEFDHAMRPTFPIMFRKRLREDKLLSAKVANGSQPGWPI